MSGTDRAIFVSGVFCIRSALSDLIDGSKWAGWAAQFSFVFHCVCVVILFSCSILTAVVPRWSEVVFPTERFRARGSLRLSQYAMRIYSRAVRSSYLMTRVYKLERYTARRTTHD